MQADSFFRGCRHSEHYKTSGSSFCVSPSAFFPNDKILSEYGTYDTSVCWRDDDQALQFFYTNDKKIADGENTKHGISEIDSAAACRNIIDAGFQNIVSINHYPDPGDPANIYHGNISFIANYKELLKERFPEMPKKERLRQIGNCFAMAEKSFYTPHDLQCMFPEE